MTCRHGNLSIRIGKMGFAATERCVPMSIQRIAEIVFGSDCEWGGLT